MVIIVDDGIGVLQKIGFIRSIDEWSVDSVELIF
jgi:hypothetical protein